LVGQISLEKPTFFGFFRVELSIERTEKTKNMAQPGKKNWVEPAQPDFWENIFQVEYLKGVQLLDAALRRRKESPGLLKVGLGSVKLTGDQVLGKEGLDPPKLVLDRGELTGRVLGEGQCCPEFAVKAVSTGLDGVDVSLEATPFSLAASTSSFLYW